MASKQTKGEKLSLDDYDFGNEFDFEEFDLKPKPPQNKREAMERIGSGVIEGVGETLKSPSFFRAMIKKALPRGYGDMLDIADHSATTIRELYNEGVQEVKPALRDLARTTDKLLPSAEQYLPKAASDALKKFVNANKEDQRPNIDGKTMADLAVADMLGQTFQFTAQQDARREAKQDVKDQLSQTINNERHQDQLAQLNGIRRGVVQMAAYQSRVEYGFHRKSLELQMRHYFVAVDTLNEQKRQNVVTTEHLAGILNNTALPDFVKMKTSERFKDMMRNKFLNSLQDGLFGARDNYIKRLGESIRTQAMEGIKGFASGISAGAQGIEIVHDANQQVDDFGVDKFKLAGNQIGSLGAEWAGKVGGGWLGKKIGNTNNQYGKKIRTVGNKLQYAAQNAPQMLNDFSNSSTDAQTYAERFLNSGVGSRMSEGWRDRIARAIGAVGDPLLDISRGTIRRANARDTTVQQGGMAELNTPAVFSNKAHQSLVEIIPGYLARIYQELQIQRTGDPNVDLAQYDYSRGAFSTTKAVRKAVFGNLFNDRAKQGVADEREKLLKLVDPQGTLSAEQRRVLADRLMADNLGQRSGYEAGKIGNYTHAGAFGTTPEEKQHADKFAELFKTLKNRDDNNENKISLDFSERFSSVGRSMNNNEALVQQLLDVYPRDLLESMKILKPGSKQIDMQQMYRYFGGDKYQATGVVAPGGMRGLRRRSVQGPAPSESEPTIDPASIIPTTQATHPPAGNEDLIAEIKKLIEVVEKQNAQPLLSEIKDLLAEMKERVSRVESEQAGPPHPSAMDQARGMWDDVSSGAQDLLAQTNERLTPQRERLMRQMRRQMRRGQVQAGRLWNRRGEVRDRADALMEEYDVRNRASQLRDQAQTHAERLRDRLTGAWQDRPSEEELRSRIGRGMDQARQVFNQARAGVGEAGNRISQQYAAWRDRPAAPESSAESNNLLTQIKDTLLDIKQRLDDGILTQGMPADGQMPKGNWFSKLNPKRLNFRISDIAKGMWGLTKGVGNLGSNVIGGVLGTTAKLTYGLAKNTFNFGTKAISGMATSQYRRARGFVDIYVGNETTPRMYARMLQEGNVYFDKASGKPIRRLKDITGTVIKKDDQDGERVVLEESEIPEAWCREGVVKKSLKAMGVVTKTIYGIGKKVSGVVLGGLPVVYRLGLWGAKKAWGMLDMPQDIFVKDQLDSPAMTARIMRAGGYRSAVTGKVISKPSQIDGPVLSGDETVLTHDDIRKGLVDKNNRPIRTGLAKLFGLAGDVAGMAWKVAKAAGRLGNKAVSSVVSTGLKGLKAVKDVTIGVGGGVFDVLRGKNPFATMAVASEKTNRELLANGVQTNDWLKQIHDLIDQRLPAKKKHTALDSDDDGIRDGSYEDQMRKKAKQEAAAAEAAPQAGKPGVGAAKGGGLLAGAKSLWNKLRGKKEDGEEGDTNINIGGSGGGEGKSGPRPKKGPGLKETKGVWGKTKWLAKAGGSKLWGATKFLGKGAMALAGLDGLAALAGGAGTMLAGAGSAIATGAGVIGSGLAAAGSAIAGVLSAPVLLGAAAVAAVGIGGYFAYKYLTKRKTGLISQIRYVQYGFSPTDKDHVGAVFGLEDKLKPGIVYGTDGAKIDDKKVDLVGLLKDFDIDEKDTDKLNKWLAWFTGRFKPVFLTHVTALKGVAGDKWLSDVDKLEVPQQLAYFNATKFPDGPYGVTVSPFEDLKELPSGSGDVKAIVALVDIELKKQSKSAGAATATGVGAAAAGVGALGVANPVSELNQPVKGEVPTVPSLNPNLYGEIAKANVNTSGLSAMGGQTSLAGSGAILDSLGSNRLDAVDVVRLKTYGLVKMELDKVKSIRILEKDIASQITFSSNVAGWSGSLEQVLKANAPAFGVDTSDEEQSKRWLLWFNQRFLPVYLNYATLVKAQTGKENPNDGKDLLKPNQQLDLAVAIYTTSNKANGGSTSIWQVSASPWADYQLNSDVKSVEANIQGLKEMAKNTVLSEPGSNVPNQPTAGKSQANAAATAASNPTGFFNNLWAKTKNVFSSSAGGFSSGPPVGGGAGTAGGAPSDMSGGRVMQQPGKGTGGDINSIPLPKGNKSWAALKDTILAAAKMVGVDPKLMSVMAAIESGFDYTVKAGTSSARGLYQFIDSTWKHMLQRFAGKYGIDPNTPQTDPRANALMGAEYIKDNAQALDGKLNRPLTDTDIYFAHFLGSGGAKKLLSADPNTVAAQLLPDAARANQGIFYKDGNPLTVGQVYQLVNGRVKNKAKGFGIGDGGEEMVSSTPTTPKPNAEAGGEPAAGGKAQADVAGKPDAGKPTSQGIGASTAPASTPAPAPQTASTATPAPAPAPAAQSTPRSETSNIQIGMAPGIVPPTNRMADVAKQAQLQSEIRIAGLVETNKVLSDTLAVAKESRDHLKTIADRILEAVKSSSKVAEATPSSTPTSQETRGAQRQIAKLPSAPLSVSKPAYPYGNG